MRHTINGHVRNEKKCSNVVFVAVWDRISEDSRLSLCYDIAAEIFNEQRTIQMVI